MLKSQNCNINTKNGVMYITFPILEKYGVKHCFSTRIGGVSEGRYATMNLSYTNGDKEENVRENFRRITGCIGVESSSVVMTHQTHTVNLKNINETTDTVPQNIDGIMTNKKGITLCSSYADCVPLIFYDTQKKVIATSHSGWRGTVNEIGRLTVEKMTADYDSNPKDIVAVIGPSICSDCYEVDDTVIDCVKKLKYLNFGEVITDKTQGKYLLDLKGVCKATLEFSGIPKENILVSDICTCCNSEFLHSHRATGGERGNLCAFLAL